MNICYSILYFNQNGVLHVRLKNALKMVLSFGYVGILRFLFFIILKFETIRPLHILGL
jgi:hypothetical protein